MVINHCPNPRLAFPFHWKAPDQSPAEVLVSWDLSVYGPVLGLTPTSLSYGSHESVNHHKTPWTHIWCTSSHRDWCSRGSGYVWQGAVCLCNASFANNHRASSFQPSQRLRNQQCAELSSCRVYNSREHSTHAHCIGCVSTDLTLVMSDSSSHSSQTLRMQYLPLLLTLI